MDLRIPHLVVPVGELPLESPVPAEITLVGRVLPNGNFAVDRIKSDDLVPVAPAEEPS